MASSMASSALSTAHSAKPTASRGFGPVRVFGRVLGVQLPGPRVDLCLDVVPLGGGVGLHLRPLAARAGGGLVGLLLRVLDGPVEVGLGLVDSPPELLTRLGDGSLHRRPGRRDTPLELIQSCGKVHDSSLDYADCRSRPPPLRTDAPWHYRPSERRLRRLSFSAAAPRRPGPGPSQTPYQLFCQQ